MKVLHLPTNVAGMSWGLAEGERKLGLASTVLASREEGAIRYPNDICLHWETKSALGELLSAVSTFLQVRNRFDVFHFNFGRTLIDYHRRGIFHLDLPYYPKGKKRIFTYNGCDARQKDKAVTLYNICPCRDDACYGGMCVDGTVDQLRRTSIEKVSRFADHIFAVNPDLLNYLPKQKSSFLPYAIAPWFTIERMSRVAENKKISIVHAPTNKAAKGSAYVIDAVNKLAEKYPVELVLVENVSHQEALRMYAQGDLIVDQVLAGWYGGFAVEVMKMGKPVAVYIREEDLPRVPPMMARDLLDAVINVNPDTIAEVLETYLQNRSMLQEKSEACYEYALKWHDPLYVAGLTKQIYEG